MRKLLLFDIDRTLLTTAGDDRYVRAINKVCGLDIHSHKDFNGYTDYLILIDLLQTEGWRKPQIDAVMPKLVEALDHAHQKTFHSDNIRLIPGVRELLKALHELGFTLGLVTGNLQSIAQRKLEAIGIWSYFTVGGFGSDSHTTRSDLVRLAVQRAGFENDIADVYVIGDTSLDIQAAKEAGIINNVGVGNGFRSTQELIDAGAAIVLEDFTDTEAVLQKLGLPNA